MLMILAVFSIFFGFITKDMFIGLGSGFFSDNALFIHPSHEIMLDTEFGVPTLFKLLPLVFTISLSVISIVLSEYLSTILIYFKLSRVGYNIFSFFNQRFLIELFYNRYITGIVLKLGGQTTKVLDKGSVEYIGPYGLEKGLFTISKSIASLNTGNITTYGLYMVVGLTAYLIFSSQIDSPITIIFIFVSLSSIMTSSSTYPLTVLTSSWHSGGSSASPDEVNYQEFYTGVIHGIQYPISKYLWAWKYLNSTMGENSITNIKFAEYLIKSWGHICVLNPADSYIAMFSGYPLTVQISSKNMYFKAKKCPSDAFYNFSDARLAELYKKAVLEISDESLIVDIASAWHYLGMINSKDNDNVIYVGKENISKETYINDTVKLWGEICINQPKACMAAMFFAR
jgi:hypothetical protein